MKYILVHGGWQGPWCWQKLIPFLKKEGHEIESVEFPGYDQITPSKITYRDYYGYLENEISKQEDPIILVSHSMSGIVAGPITDRLGHKIKHSFFIAAFLPQFGESLLDIALRYDDSDIPKVLETDAINRVHTIDKVKAKEVFFHDCTPDMKEWAVNQLRAQPYAPLETPLDWRDSLQNTDKRTYIVCEKDRNVSVSAQYDMATLHQCKIVSLKSGHFPFLSQPRELSKILMSY